MIKMAFIYETSAILFINIKQLKFTKYQTKIKKVLVFYKKNKSISNNNIYDSNR